ncbi:MAG: MerR family DNA-binding transcriptional regulator [Micrococcales bacterium]|nr:MerR family DNA-binding transcriptional regulator [Micrococcales bacterium]
MRIGELSRFTGVSARCLRHYEEAGLISPDRLDSGYRDYDSAQVITVGLIKTLIAAGLPVSLIAEVLPCVPAVGGYGQPTEALAARLEQLCEELRAQREEFSRAILILGGVTARTKPSTLT